MIDGHLEIIPVKTNERRQTLRNRVPKLLQPPEVLQNCLDKLKGESFLARLGRHGTGGSHQPRGSGVHP